jgi:hypothetical protein
VKIGDVVMFVDEGRYARWFFGQMATVTHCSRNSSGESHCRVKWMQPVPYHGKVATISDFAADKFQMVAESP